MSRFLSEKYNGLKVYTPGEQPKDRTYVKLNTNESPFPPSPYAMRLARIAAGDLQLYCDPDCGALISAAAEKFGIEEDEIIFTNGSDEALWFAFMAFCDNGAGAAFPDITYGFYRVFAGLFNLPYTEIPLKSDLSVDADDYAGINKTVFIANPNAPTGKALPLCDIERIVKSNPSNVVVVDEAYVDFGGQTALPLIKKYDNLLVVRTFSKSRSLAGARLGFAMGNKELIKDLKAIKYSTNPYNVNRMTQAAGLGALLDGEYFDNCVTMIVNNRKYLSDKLKELGFTLTDSKANFVFAKKDGVAGKDLYLKLKSKGVLVRHFDAGRTADYVRITVGDMREIETLLAKLEEIL